MISLVVAGQEKEVKRIQQATGVNAPIEKPRDPISASLHVAKPETTRPKVDRGHRRPRTDSGTVSIFVGNLPWRADEADLESLFAPYGRVDGALIAKKSGRSKGYGFVEMATAPAHQAIKELNSYELEGRSIQVRQAR